MDSPINNISFKRLRVLKSLGIPYGTSLPTDNANTSRASIFVLIHATDATKDKVYTYDDVEDKWNPQAGGGVWGAITGTIGNQTDLQGVLDLKADLVSGKIPAAQLPSYVDDVIEGDYINTTTFKVDGVVITPETGKIYIDVTSNNQYRWSGSLFIELTASPGTTDAVPEGTTNLYFTVARVLATVLTGLSVLVGGDIVATDTILIAFGKIQKRFNDLLTNFNGPDQLLKMGSDNKLGPWDGSNLTNLPNSGGGEWGTITGDMSDQTDLTEDLEYLEDRKLDQYGQKIYGIATGTNLYTVSFTPAITSLVEGAYYYIKFPNRNTGGCNVTIPDVGTYNLFKRVNEALVADDIKANKILTVIFDGTNLQIVGSDFVFPTISGGEKALTLTSTGVQKDYDVVPPINANVDALMAADWSTGKAYSIAGYQGQTAYSYDLNIRYDCIDNAGIWIRTIPLPKVSSGEKVVTIKVAGAQVDYDLVTINNTTALTALELADWSTGIVTGISGYQGQVVYSADNTIKYNCYDSTGKWVKQLMVLQDYPAYLTDIDDSGGSKTSADLQTAYPASVPGQKVRGINNIYEKMTATKWNKTASVEA